MIVITLSSFGFTIFELFGKANFGFEQDTNGQQFAMLIYVFAFWWHIFKNS